MKYIRQQFVNVLIIFILVLSLGSLKANFNVFFVDTSKANGIQPSNLKNDTVLLYTEKKPEFPGGNDGLMNFIYKNIRFPSKAVELGIGGKVIIQFVVNKEGKVINPKIIRGVGGGCDEEAIRVVNLLPRWTPGQQNGCNVSTYFTLPITFKNQYNYDGEKQRNFLSFIGENQVKVPSFPGGNDSLNQFLIKNMKYPKDAEEKGIGGTVLLRMDVTKEGKITDPKVIKGVCFSVDSEALRIIKLFPKLIPAKKNNESIELKDYSLEFTFEPNKKYSNKMEKDTLGGKEEPLSYVEEMPEFPGGIDAMMRYLYNTIKYPKEATKLGITGRVVLQFIINKQGDVTDIKVLRSLGGGCDEEAVRVVKSFPNWKPGMHQGKQVSVYFTLPIMFSNK